MRGWRREGSRRATGRSHAHRRSITAGAYLDDDHVLVGVFTASYNKDETELHLVLERPIPTLGRDR
jgi:hypothetical protein